MIRGVITGWAIFSLWWLWRQALGPRLSALLHCSNLVGVVLPVSNTYHRHIHHPHRPHSLVLRKSQPKSLYHPELEAILMLGATVWGSTYEVLHALQGLPKQLNSVTAFFPIFGSLGIFPRNGNLNILLRIHMLGIFKPPLREPPMCTFLSRKEIPWIRRLGTDYYHSLLASRACTILLPYRKECNSYAPIVNCSRSLAHDGV